MTSRRFYLPGPLRLGCCRLGGAQARHLALVLRIRPGEEITLFDGTGLEATAAVTAIEDARVDLAVGEVRAAQCEPPTPVILATAVPKGERYDWLIEKATELGVAKVVPLVTERSVVVPGAAKLDRLRRKVVEASKQCGRSRLMEISSPVRWEEFVECELVPHGCWVAHPAGEPLTTRPHAAGSGPKGAAAFVGAIGPEGGWTDGELERARSSGARVVSLGPRVMRIETAALVLAALLSDVTIDQ